MLKRSLSPAILVFLCHVTSCVTSNFPFTFGVAAWFFLAGLPVEATTTARDGTLATVYRGAEIQVR